MHSPMLEPTSAAIRKVRRGCEYKIEGNVHLHMPARGEDIHSLQPRVKISIGACLDTHTAT